MKMKAYNMQYISIQFTGMQHIRNVVGGQGWGVFMTGHFDGVGRLAGLLGWCVCVCVCA